LYDRVVGRSEHDRKAARRTLRPRSGSSAKALLLTVLGEFVLPHGGSAWTSTLVRALGAAGVEERNARQATARLADQGLLRSERQGRRVRWRLTDDGYRLLTVGTERIYGFGTGDAPWDGRWLVVLSSIPEEQRAKRHQLRSQLAFAGFGFLGPGSALSPHLDREDAANAVLKELGLLPGAVVLRAESGELVDDHELLRRAWDLDGLAAAYEQFIDDFDRQAPTTDEACFAAVAQLVHAWRRFPFVDPEIPRQLLPDGWVGARAKRLFDARHAAWSSGAQRWYEGVEAT
jgi:phenylacetic acid degradation operon negative regulatory protein